MTPEPRDAAIPAAPPSRLTVRFPNGSGATNHGAPWQERWLRADRERTKRMDLQSRINRVVMDAILEAIDGEPVDIAAILNGLDDAKADIPGVILHRAAIQKSEALA